MVTGVTMVLLVVVTNNISSVRNCGYGTQASSMALISTTNIVNITTTTSLQDMPKVVQSEKLVW